MKRTLIIALALALTNIVSAQIADPVKWSFSKKKVNATTFELQLKATIDGGWHIYSQFTPAGGPVPTSIRFITNPLVKTEGNTEEEGKLEQKREEVFGVDVKQFAGEVTFVQQVTVKPGVKTKMSGTVKYMVCNDAQCLPPKEQSFTINLP